MKSAFNYVDAFVIPVPTKNLVAYKKMAKVMAKICVENGALSYAECQADDVEAGEETSFPKSVKMKKNETVFLAIITYKNRAHQNSVMKKIMADPRMDKMSEMNLVDGMRMFWGGFKAVVKA